MRKTPLFKEWFSLLCIVSHSDSCGISFNSWFPLFTCLLPFCNELQDRLSGEVKVKGFQNWLSICQLFVVVFFLFYYSLLVYLLCVVFLIRKVERRGEKPWHFCSCILLSLSWLGRIILFYETDEQHKDCVHTATAITGQYFGTVTWRHFEDNLFPVVVIFQIGFHLGFCCCCCIWQFRETNHCQ